MDQKAKHSAEFYAKKICYKTLWSLVNDAFNPYAATIGKQTSEKM